MKVSFLMVVTIALYAFCMPHVRAQNGALPQDKCTIGGTVIDAVSGEPLKGAVVKLGGTAMPNDPAPAAPSVFASTDSNGRFVFEGLSAGRYLLLASHDGYVKSQFGDLRGKSLLLSPGRHVNDVVVRLLPNSSISGHITNEAGKPLRGVSVQAMKSSYLRGRHELHDVARAVTSEAGEYRITGLPPGKYCLYFKPPASPKPVAAHDKSNDKSNDKSYVPVYYPAANDRAHAIALVVRAGDELAGIDMNLVPVRTVHIRGRVINARTASASNEAEVTLLSDQGETIFLPGRSFSASAFEFRGVPPGYYVVVAQQPSTPKEPKTMWGWTSVEVKETDVEHVDVVVSPGADVTGHIRMEGKTAEDFSKEIGSMVGVLEPQEAQSLASLTPDIDNASVRPDGTFIFREVPEGSYRINFSPVPSGFYLRSGDASETLETGITVSRGHSPASLDLVLNPGAGRVDGTVESDEQPVPSAVVALVPDGKQRAQPNYYRQAFTDHLGRFVLRNVVPGNYTLFAWEQVDRDAFFDPEFLAQYEDRGKAVHVEEGDHITVKLDEIPATETVP
jgi:protocatechuate 3,4-dioxygenase beta subunit